MKSRYDLKYLIFQIDAGWIGILQSADGLLCITLPQPNGEDAQRQMGELIIEADHSPIRLDNLAKRLRAYWNGETVPFPDKLDFSNATPFQRMVWEQTRLIPYGETRSYQWVASQIGKAGAARAVGQALGKNPFPVIVPCHRVVSSNGKLGGFSGGLAVKSRMLDMEKGPVLY